MSHRIPTGDLLASAVIFLLATVVLPFDWRWSAIIVVAWAIAFVYLKPR